jgi:hypothetical protein
MKKKAGRSRETGPQGRLLGESDARIVPARCDKLMKPSFFFT